MKFRQAKKIIKTVKAATDWKKRYTNDQICAAADVYYPRIDSRKK